MRIEERNYFCIQIPILNSVTSLFHILLLILLEKYTQIVCPK